MGLEQPVNPALGSPLNLLTPGRRTRPPALTPQTVPFGDLLGSSLRTLVVGGAVFAVLGLDVK